MLLFHSENCWKRAELSSFADILQYLTLANSKQVRLASTHKRPLNGLRYRVEHHTTRGGQRGSITIFKFKHWRESTWLCTTCLTAFKFFSTCWYLPKPSEQLRFYCSPVSCKVREEPEEPVPSGHKKVSCEFINVTLFSKFVRILKHVLL